jgi:AAHS family 4-hydroxybenzoate transporter-like MFS transporter
MQDGGFSTDTAVFVGTMLQIGGTLGALGLGWFVHRIGFVRVLTTGFLLSFASILLIGLQGLPFNALVAAVFVAGLFVIGGQAAINALAATYFPAHVRSTGIGSGLGVGRIGAIMGPTIAGELMRAGWPSHYVFAHAAIFPLVAMCAVLGVGAVMRKRERESVLQPGEAR